jgi:hypothetical protein
MGKSERAKRAQQRNTMGDQMNEERKAYEDWLHKAKETFIDEWQAWQARAALAQPEPAAPTVGEPVAWIYKPNRELLWPSEVEATNPIEVDEYLPLYAHPPRTALTDEQILAIGRELGVRCKLGGNPNIDFDYARAIEAAHGIKEKV